MSGTQLIREFILSRQIRRATIIGDSDKPGWDGARRLAAVLPVPARLMLPPPGIKDLRDWVRSNHAPNFSSP